MDGFDPFDALVHAFETGDQQTREFLRAIAPWAEFPPDPPVVSIKNNADAIVDDKDKP